MFTKCSASTPSGGCSYEMLKLCLDDAETSHLLFRAAEDLARALAPECITRVVPQVGWPVSSGRLQKQFVFRISCRSRSSVHSSLHRRCGRGGRGGAYDHVLRSSFHQRAQFAGVAAFREIRVRSPHVWEDGTRARHQVHQAVQYGHSRVPMRNGKDKLVAFLAPPHSEALATLGTGMQFHSKNWASLSKRSEGEGRLWDAVG